MKIAVVGAGIFGSTIAITLARSGFFVDLFEKDSDILQAASGINQYRLHRGFHYPRSIETAISSKNAEKFFCEEYEECLIKDAEHYYCIAKEKSKVSADEFKNFCKTCSLEYEEADLNFIKKEKFQLTTKVRESLINPNVLRNIVKNRLSEYKINLLLNTTFKSEDMAGYDIVINSSYANLNFIQKDNSKFKTYQFELCEKPLLSLPKTFAKKSVVVMDGPFFCIDPYADTDFHLMGNVFYALHHSNVGFFPEIPDQYRPLLNKGVIQNPPITNIDKFIDSAKEFMPEIAEAKHIGSMYTIRTVLANVDHTDERPTIVNKIDEKVIEVFSGKLGNCVQAANEVLHLLKQ